MLRLFGRAPRISIVALFILAGPGMAASRAQDAATPTDNGTADTTVTVPATDEASAIVDTPSRLIDEPKGPDSSPNASKPAPSANVVARQGGDPCAEALRRATAEQQRAAAATHTIPAPLALPPECAGPVSPRSTSP